MKRIKSLDGIRAICIVVVLLSHALETMPAFITQNHLISSLISNAGQLGVRIFFAISGYLITKLLLLERKKTGKVDIKNFYIRRMFRIFPVFFMYILVVLVLKWTIIPDIFSSYTLILFAALYLWNYKHFFIHENPSDHGNWYVGHFWSLSMEEQFYLLWPLMFTKIKPQALIKVVLALIVLMPFLRIVTFLWMPVSKPYTNMMLHTGGDTILIGCLGALIEKKSFFKAFQLKCLQNHLFMILLLSFLFIGSPLLTIFFGAPYNLLAGFSLNNIAIMIFIYWTIYVESPASRLLNTRVFIHVGILSYSLYVWQQLFLTTKTAFWVNKFPQNILASAVVAVASYYILEKPILKLKEKYKKV